MIHIEGRAKAQTTSNWLTALGFFFVIATLCGFAFHFKVMGVPRRLKKDLERGKVLDRIHDLEQVLVDLGQKRGGRRR